VTIDIPGASTHALAEANRIIHETKGRIDWDDWAISERGDVMLILRGVSSELQVELTIDGGESNSMFWIDKPSGRSDTEENLTYSQIIATAERLGLSK
jgi:hypothetical protein